MTNVKNYSCSNCNKSFEAYPPDDIFTKARINECMVCKYLKKTQIKRIVECENCDSPNILYWHTDYVHTIGEHNEAKRKRNQSLNINLDVSSEDKISLNRD